jgi:hypothetical protein
VSERAFQTVRISDVEGANGQALLRAHLDVRSFGLNAFTGHEVGAAVIPAHDELGSRHEEVYVVVAGVAGFTVADEEFDAATGTVVHVPAPETVRAAVAREPGTTVLAIGALPGEAFRPMAWEANAAVLERFEAEDYAGAKRLLLDAFQRYGEQDLLHYNLACAEARLGETDAALDELATSIEQRPAFAENARSDPDLASLHGHERFARLVGEA